MATGIGRRVTLSAAGAATIVAIAAGIAGRDWILDRIDALRGEPFLPLSRTVRKKLEQAKLTFSFDQRPLKEVLYFLREQTGFEIVVDPAIDTEGIAIDLTGKDLDAHTALRMVLFQAGLTCRLDKSVIHIVEGNLDCDIEPRRFPWTLFPSS